MSDRNPTAFFPAAAVKTCVRENAASCPKNRVGVFSRHAVKPRRVRRPQVAQFVSGYSACGYKPASGRGFFINRDPIEESGGINLYGFCGNDGVNNWDMLGNATAGENFAETGSPFGASDGMLTASTSSDSNTASSSSGTGASGDNNATAIVQNNPTAQAAFQQNIKTDAQKTPKNDGAITGKEVSAVSTNTPDPNTGKPQAPTSTAEDEFKNVEFTATLMTRISGHAEELIKKAKEQFISLSHSTTDDGQLTQIAKDIQTVRANKNGTVTIEVTNSTDHNDFGTDCPEGQFNSTITYNPNYAQVMGKTGIYENGLTLLTHEFSHATDFTTLASDYIIAKVYGRTGESARVTEFEAVRVENQIRQQQKMDLRTVYEFPAPFGGTQNEPVPNYDKYTKHN